MDVLASVSPRTIAYTHLLYTYFCYQFQMEFFHSLK